LSGNNRAGLALIDLLQAENKKRQIVSATPKGAAQVN
jgi:hypothetical protein